MKLLPIPVVAILAVTSIFLGLNGHPVLACVSGDLAAALLIVIVVHIRRQPSRRYDQTLEGADEAGTEIDRRSRRPISTRELYALGRDMGRQDYK